MLGQLILDPEGIESTEAISGLSLLPISTTMRTSKITITSIGQLIAPSLFGQPVANIALRGYEIHVGETSCLGQAQPFAQLMRRTDERSESVTDGCISPDTRIFGTYLHGLFDEDGFRHAFISAARAFHRLTPATELNNWRSRREESLDRLADVVNQSLDMPTIFEWAGLRYQPLSISEGLVEAR